MTQRETHNVVRKAIWIFGRRKARARQRNDWLKESSEVAKQGMGDKREFTWEQYQNKQTWMNIPRHAHPAEERNGQWKGQRGHLDNLVLDREWLVLFFICGALCWCSLSIVVIICLCVVIFVLVRGGRNDEGAR